MMDLRVVSETPTTITLGWTPVPNSIGYVLYVDGTRTSNSWDPSKSTWKVQKGASKYEVVALGRLDSGVYPPPVAVPVVSSFSPTSGAVGAPVSVGGQNFTGATTVKFNGVSASFNVASATGISTSVPTSATSGLISVTTPAGTGSSASPFSVTVTPPPTGKLKWKPPGWNGGNVLDPASFPGFAVLNITKPGTYNLSGDTYVKINVNQTAPASGGRSSVQLVGGRHVVCFGGSVKLPSQATNGDAADPTCVLVDAGDPSGIIHLEGCDFQSVNGVTWRTPRRLQLEWSRVVLTTFQGDHNDAHADVIQIWDGGANQSNLRVDYLTARSDYTGYSVLIDNPVSWEMHHLDHQGPQGPAVYYGDGKSCLWTGDNLYYKGINSTVKLDDALAGWGTDNAAYEIHPGPGQSGGTYTSPLNPPGGNCPPPLGTRTGDYITFAREPKLQGISWIQGVPPGGDFVPAGTVGAAYVPKGYA